MIFPNHHAGLLTGVLLTLVACLVQTQPVAATTAQITNPISRIARIFDSQLVNVEDRVTLLSQQLSTLPPHFEYPLKVALGYRGCRSSTSAGDPSVILDLGREYPIESIVLVPTQREYLNDHGIFPKRFTLDLSNENDFARRTILFSSGTIQHPSPEGLPVRFNAKDTARYVRLTVQEGHNPGILDLFGLSEIIVISNGDPVSFGATVISVGTLDVPKLWYPDALTDGRSPLGIWQNEFKPSPKAGDAVELKESSDQTTTWTIQLDATRPVDRIVLFPYQLNNSFEASIFPETLTIDITAENGSKTERVFERNNPLPGTSCKNPIVVPLKGKSAKTLKITAVRPWMIGFRKIHALSEIEVWSGGQNLALGRKITREHDGRSTSITSLTDGYTSERMIAPVGVWLQQLYDRGRIERELASLHPIHQQLTTRSELNATWGSAVILGLTFLIPVFMVERRRLMSREHINQIRKKIASDLHDDIGSNLGSISLIARSARKDLERLHGPEEIAEDLGEMEAIARESSLAMRDIVWLLEQRHDSIGDLVQRMRETAGRLLREISFTIECETSKTTAKLSLDAKRHLFLFYKEAIHNILKHSHADRVSIRLWDESDKLAIEIIDNGIGLPNTTKDKPVIIRKLKDRANVLDGILQIFSSKETGTRILLLVKRTHLTTLSS